MTYLTVPISAEKIEAAKEQIISATKRKAEMLELRLDCLGGLDIEMAVELIRTAKKSELPILTTCRDEAEGGKNGYDENLRKNVLAQAIDAGVDFVDCEFENFCRKDFAEPVKKALAENPKTKLILSAHNFKSKFQNARKLHSEITALFPDCIAKLAYKAENINDCFEAFDILSENKNSIVICMGQAGIISRVIAKKLGTVLTFASLDENSATADGQISIEKMKKLCRFDSIDEATELYGIIADPVGHSIGPAVHNHCFAAEKMNRLYLPLLVEGGQRKFGEFLDNVLKRPWLGFKGFSVTLPHKTNALEYVTKSGNYIEPLAEKIGAVNTLVIGCNDRISAYNTDYAGALDALTGAMGIGRKHLKKVGCAVIGAGGAGRAIVAGLADAGAKVTIYNRTEKKAQNLALEFGCRHAPIADVKNTDAKIIINCTSIGMSPNVNASPVPKETIKPDMVVFDTVYNPAETLLLAEAKEIGAKTVGGSEMFIGQAAEQFKHFTQKSCDESTMRSAVAKAMRR
ncbi:MAG: shikimate dehydrogenase [Anaerohalosphaeraceae bacterium]|nr:shikimate dehydrogenase [Anaerohalosphaeraceae bacterium]